MTIRAPAFHALTVSVTHSLADVIFIAEHLEKKARENQAKAGWMRDVAGAMKAHKVAHVRDLPDDVLASFLTGEAA